MLSRPRAVIIGGGISGLATAHYLHQSLGDGVLITVLEASPRLGGKIITEDFAGHSVDAGPDALMVRAPVAVNLLTDLGLADLVVAPASGGSRIWSRGRLRTLPAGTVFGIPDRLLPLLRSRLLSPLGFARVLLDLVLPAGRTLPADPTIAEIVVPRMGHEVFDRLVDPLLGGIHAGRADELSAHSTAPDIEVLARGKRSLNLALRRRRRAGAAMAAAASRSASVPVATAGDAAAGSRATAPAATAPRLARAGGATLVTVEGGLARLIDALAARAASDDIRLGTAATSLAREGAGYLVGLSDGTSAEADAVVIATPAFVAAGLLLAENPVLGAALAGIPYTDVATICLAYPRSALGRPLGGNGFLVPPVEGKLVVGCTFSSEKWPHLADEETVIIRCMVGRAGDTRWAGFDDTTLVAQVHAELVEALGLTGRPTSHHIERWPLGMPQYVVGHQGRLDTADRELAALPGVHLTGSGYRGVGLASCVADAERVATRIAESIAAGTIAAAKAPSEVGA
ncbi:protoporphyrinogen oxidase [Cryobacterium sp. 10C2]|uniref:protoporphyrinogen oxidase n=1 Tax=Cryobacterium sp. 10C2 TaxID=3048576 RepID=UPI002AB33B43|nr:protoporphyrinogen oxidase [Cryobacterium sp. 10C2]MDY7526542.1 protoporphyrinogen oxidase [Cryobacterium sp. 10C2]MEB0289900.1 protoporphyrinogen oxidase [Cryobacterium sp. 10C2]